MAVAAVAVPDQLGDTGDQRPAAAGGIVAANLDPDRPDPALAVRRCEHRQPRRQTVATVGRDASAQARRLRKGVVQQDRRR